MFFKDVLHNVRASYRCSLFKTVYNCCETGFGRARLVPRTRASSDGVDDSDSREWIYLKRGVVLWRTWPNRSMWTPHHALRWDGRLETKVGPKADLINSGQTGFFLLCRHKVVLVKILLFLDTQIPYSAAIDLVAGFYFVGTTWHTTHVDGFIRRAHLWRLFPSSSYSLMEIVPERDSISVIDLSKSETIKGPVVQGVEPGVSIEEDPSEAESDGGMLPEPEGVAPVDDEGTSIGGSEGRYVGDGASSSTGGRQLLAQLQPPINVLDKDHGNPKIQRDPLVRKGSEMKAGEP
ncbi:hypothetical protein M9H77_21831 [Catharanthus roseus]|uniref:Uncharacterized protein n=1 Tax=Catharanthus roseus TaxID=4058 RepID=A0ACC0ARD1_CATRO|nr:hypothetical protein M9H77_21831 [Catharanthus roseus]